MKFRISEIILFVLLLSTIVLVIYGINRIQTEGGQCLINPITYYENINNISIPAQYDPRNFEAFANYPGKN